MSEIILKVENLFKQYRLGLVGTEGLLAPEWGQSVKKMFGEHF